MKPEKVRNDCSPEFSKFWNDAEQRPSFWLELIALEVEEQIHRLKQVTDDKTPLFNFKEFDQWMKGRIAGLNDARKIIRKAIRKQHTIK